MSRLIALVRLRPLRHRLVDSIRLMDERSARRQMSLDLTYPRELEVPYPLGDTSAERVVLPLTKMSKGVLRAFDAREDDGTPIPVMNRREGSWLTATILLAQYFDDAESPDPDLLEDIVDIIAANPSGARRRLAALKKKRPQLSAQRPDLVAELDQYLDDFLLILTPSRRIVGRRTVIKWSFHWERKSQQRRQGILHRLLSAAFETVLMLPASSGWNPTTLNIALASPADAESYHLEVHAPPGIFFAGLELPPGQGADLHGDRMATQVAHAVASYPQLPESNEAELRIVGPNGGLRVTALMVSVFTAVFLLLGWFLPGAHLVLLQHADGAAPMMLTVPAAVAIVLNRPGENYIAELYWRPLRWLITFWSIILFICGLSLVGELHDPWRGSLWTGAGVSALAMSVFQAAAIARSIGGPDDAEQGRREA